MGKILKRCFGTIPHAVLYDPRISAKAKGLWVYIQAKPEDYNFSSVRMADEMADGIDAIRSGLQELERFGLLTRKTSKGEDGRFEHEYELMEVPVPESPARENPAPGKPAPNKERESKKEVERKTEQDIVPTELRATPVRELSVPVPIIY